MISDSCSITLESSNKINFKSVKSQKRVVVKLAGHYVNDVFTNLMLIQGCEIDLSVAYVMGIIISNDSNVWNPCKEIFSMDLLKWICNTALTMENILLFLNVSSCFTNTIVFETDDNDTSTSSNAAKVENKSFQVSQPFIVFVLFSQDYAVRFQVTLCGHFLLYQKHLDASSALRHL